MDLQNISSLEGKEVRVNELGEKWEELILVLSLTDKLRKSHLRDNLITWFVNIFIGNV